MSTIKIVTDDASDIPLKHEDLYDIEVLPVKITLGDEVYSGRKELDGAEFYDMLDQAEEIPETSPISSFEFGELFSDLFEQGYTDIIYISSSSNGSASYCNSVLARDQFFEDIPEAANKINIYCMDSGSYSAGYGYAAIEAAKMADRGKDPKEIIEHLRLLFASSKICFGLYSLKFAKKSPILPTDFSVIDLIGFRPIMMAKDGGIEVVSKARESSLAEEIAEISAEQIKKGTPYSVIYSSDSEQKDILSSALTKALGYPPADAFRIGAAVATHTGPEAIGVVFQGD